MFFQLDKDCSFGNIHNKAVHIGEFINPSPFKTDTNTDANIDLNIESKYNSNQSLDFVLTKLPLPDCGIWKTLQNARGIILIYLCFLFYFLFIFF